MHYMKPLLDSASSSSEEEVRVVFEEEHYTLLTHTPAWPQSATAAPKSFEKNSKK